jgi:2-C-methyl-D-erythritol 2,4-cyclodiphosphate synthase|tara:strand:- start:2537 stop:3025 length:489 start_codon:yes stop_codon:yes gene_type:complete
MSNKIPFRVGLGYDVHRLVAGRRLVLGGVEIPSEVGLEGHSDADVLSHALSDAILGAAGLPDIGHYFPNTDASIEGIDSQVILKRCAEEVAALGWAIGNLDAMLVAEAPKISPYLDEMKQCLSQTLGLPADVIGIKATTHERLGDIGRGLGMSAQAVCLLYR